jgi:hypothetical protein
MRGNWEAAGSNGYAASIGPQTLRPPPIELDEPTIGDRAECSARALVDQAALH